MTINNDLPATEVTIGSDTALNSIVADVGKINQSAVATRHCFVVEVMATTRATSHHPGAQVVCRDGSAAYAEAIRQGAPKAVQVSDRWHLWHNLRGAVERPSSPTAPAGAHSLLTAQQSSQSAAPTRAINERTRARHAACTNCSTRAWACWNALGGWVGR
jgi:transposase